MKISDLGEFGFINNITSQIPQNLPHKTVGIGDDCAVFPIDDENSLLVTTDMLQENIHFLRDKISANNLGRKSLTVNLSDIAAMGGRPHSAYLSLALPKTTSTKWLEEFMDGFSRLCKETNTLLLGGDTTGSPQNIVINVTIIGKANSDKIKFRSSAKPGDLVCVNGFLGDSAMGLTVLKEQPNWNSNADMKNLVKAQNQPKAFLKEGLWLAQHSAVHAMMDVSDGLDSDIKHILDKSHVGANIHLEKLPLSESLINICSKLNFLPQEIAATGGEEYCLLFTIDKHEYESLANSYKRDFNSSIYAIGEITVGSELRYVRASKSVKLADRGFSHFS